VRLPYLSPSAGCPAAALDAEPEPDDDEFAVARVAFAAVQIPLRPPEVRITIASATSAMKAISREYSARSCPHRSRRNRFITQTVTPLHWAEKTHFR